MRSSAGFKLAMTDFYNQNGQRTESVCCCCWVYYSFKVLAGNKWETAACDLLLLAWSPWQQSRGDEHCCCFISSFTASVVCSRFKLKKLDPALYPLLESLNWGFLAQDPNGPHHMWKFQTDWSSGLGAVSYNRLAEENKSEKQEKE